MELIGPGVNGNWEEITEHRLYVFDVWDIKAGRYLDYAEFNQVVSEKFLVDNKVTFQAPDLGLFTVVDVEDALKYYEDDMTVIGRISLKGKIVATALDIASETASVVNPVAEGVVFRSTTSGLSFKAISNKYLLLKHE
jgi:hypothetical protein